MKIIWNRELYHYGTPRHSGRYPYGSGKNPYHHGKDIPKGAPMYRMLASPNTRGVNAKRDYMFVSDNPDDALKWGRYFNQGKKSDAYPMAEYATKKDIKVMSSKQAADILIHEVLSKKNINLTKMIEVDKIMSRMSEYTEKPIPVNAGKYYELNKKTTLTKEGPGTKKLTIPASELLVSTSIASGSQTGKELMKKILNQKFQAVEDSYGRTVSKTPYIVLQPNKNFKNGKDGYFDMEGFVKELKKEQKKLLNN